MKKTRALAAAAVLALTFAACGDDDDDDVDTPAEVTDAVDDAITEDS